MSLDPDNLPANLRRAMARPPTLRRAIGPADKAHWMANDDHAREQGVPRALVAPPPRPEPKKAAEPSLDDAEPEDAFIGAEKLLHRDFITDMERRGAHCVHARTDVQSTIGNGLPDVHVLFTGADGICRGAAVELKVKGRKLRDSQRACIIEMRTRRIPVKVCWSLKDAIDFAREALKL